MLPYGGNYHVVSRWPNAFALSTSLHVGIVVAALLIGYAAVEPTRPVVLQMVSLGRGADLTSVPATSAPLVAVKLRSLPPVPAAMPQATVQSEEAPERPAPPTAPARQPAHHAVVHAPVSPTATTRVAHSPSASSRSETMSIERFRQLHPGGAAAPHSTSVGNSVPRVQGDRIADDLRAGITATSAAVGEVNGAESADYIQRLETALGAALERIPGFDEGLHAEVEYHILADGRLTAARIVHRSTDTRFDAAIVDTVDSFNAGPRPAGLPELHRTEFATRAR